MLTCCRVVRPSMYRLSGLVSVLAATLLAGCAGSTASSGGGGGTTAPAVTFSSAALSFGTIGTGASSTVQNVTLTNSGNATLAINSATASGDFAVASNGCLATLGSGSSCVLGLTFTPTAVGARTGTLSLATNAANSPQTVALTGTGGTSQSTVSSAALVFGSVTIGNSSPSQTLTITNGGTAPLAISGLKLATGDFTQMSTNCSAAVAVGGSCQVVLLFTPTVTGTRTSTLTVTSNAGNSPQVVALSGTGLPAIVYSGLPFTVKVLAGTQPIAGASVQFYAAGVTGARSASTALLARPVTTDATGTATLTTYNCPSSTSLVYLLATGGTVGSAVAANGNTLLMSAVGPCSGIASGAKFVVNEATSVAAVYGLQQFYTAGGSLGATATNTTGMTNAFGSAAQLIDPTTGAVPASFPATASSPAARINSLANLVNGCLTVPAQCGSLYVSTGVNGVFPSNTLDALFNLAQHPAANTVALYTESLLNSAYAPALATVPADFTMFINYSGAGMNSPSGIGVDSTGSVWVANYFYVASKFTPQGLPVFNNGVLGLGLNNSYGLAIDLTDTAWIPNEQPFTNYGIGSVTRLAASGADASGTGYGYQQGGLNYPLSVAIDPNGTTWVVDYGNSHVTLLDQLGTPLSGGTGYTTPMFAFPVAVAVDANHFGWIANQSGNTVTKVAPDGSAFTNYDCCTGASGIAIDQGNNVWVANFYGDSVSLISSTGTVVSNGTYTGNGGITRPQGIAVDGSGNVWVANYRQTYLTELAGVGSTTVGASLTPKTGYGGDAGLLEAYALAIDASGNIWVSNQGNNQVTKYIGLASPVRTPLSALPKAP